ncbi:tRNA lysidine(34) synthetase TilS [Nocardia callitridis]|uniref:tRNA(Ile)-lysidine synthase n=1 Tax=Nocardia callitridis TaxID=648753 RepID=A0ABP9JZP7_9NOCA
MDGAPHTPPQTHSPGALPETSAALLMRRAVRDWLNLHTRADTRRVAVALSGGADSLALTAAAVAEADTVDALVVDHGLQPGSDAVAATAAATAMRLGCRCARVLTVRVGTDGGLEAAARQARYAALDVARSGLPVLLGHTLDDQAETVLLGLARGSGGRSIHGMAVFVPPWGRPLLDVRRDTTRQFCVDLGIRPYEDPHNASPEFTRVRLRTEVLPLLEEALGGGVAAALARTAEHLREDASVLDALAQELLVAAVVDSARTSAAESPESKVTTGAVPSVGPDAADANACLRDPASPQEPAHGAAHTHNATLSIEILRTAPTALRRRAIRSWLLRGGAKALTDKHLRAVDALVTDWRGQGGVAVGGGTAEARLVAAREHGRLTLRLRTG